MAPSSEATKLESSGAFVEYVGSGKLKDKKVIITGGEYDISFSLPGTDTDSHCVALGLGAPLLS